MTRESAGLPAAPPVRIVHVGLGNFHRAHQAWYTARASDSDGWGIAAFTGRRRDAADALSPQQGVYTLITAGADGDVLEAIGSVVAVHGADDHAAFLGYLRDPQVSVVTLTVTEAAYRRGSDGALELDADDIRSDLAALRADRSAPVRTIPARLLAGILARWQAGGEPLTVLPCDNVPDNGAVTRQVVTQMAQQVEPSLLPYLDRHVDFASCMVDRITPASTDGDKTEVRDITGLLDAAPVRTEPFSEWVIQGHFPAGRPAWETAGAVFTDDVRRFEQRKLWLLNGSHSLLAYAGSIRGHATIDEAMADATCVAWVQTLWAEARGHLPFREEEVSDYLGALSDRYRNPRIRHNLGQIAADGSQKIAIRVVPVALAELADGRSPVGCATAIAAWIAHLRGHGAPVNDANGKELQRLAAGTAHQAAERVLQHLSPELADASSFKEMVLERFHHFEAVACP